MLGEQLALADIRRITGQRAVGEIDHFVDARLLVLFCPQRLGFGRLLLQGCALE